MYIFLFLQINIKIFFVKKFLFPNTFFIIKIKNFKYRKQNYGELKPDKQ